MLWIGSAARRFVASASFLNAFALSTVIPFAAPAHVFPRLSLISSTSSTNATMTTMEQPKKVVIIGSGPAAHTAAIYLARANLNPILYEGFLAAGVAAGGQLTTTTEVENFPGFPKGITGSEMMDLFKEQSTRFGTEVITETIHRVDLSSRPFKLWTEDEQSNEKPSLLAESVVLATGATAKRLFIKGEDFYWNRGISACAVCDGAIPIFRNKPLAVVGGGDSACEEATFLTRYGSKVYLLVRKDKLRASKVMADRVLANPKIEVMWHTSAIEAHGDGKLLTSLTIEGTDGPKKGQHWPLEVNGLFYAIGHEPNSKFLLNKAGDEKHAKNPIEVDADGYVKVQPGTTLTNIEGVFACGDLQDKRYRQAITAAGSGCMAALDCERWLEAQGE